MKKKIGILVFAGVMALAVAGCTKNDNAQVQTTPAAAEAEAAIREEAAAEKPETVTVVHTMGTTEVSYEPQRIAALDLAALDILDGLGLGDKVVGIPKKSSVSYLTSYIDDSEIVNLGSVKEVDMEALNSLEPDLIIIGGRLASEYEAIAKIAPTIGVQIDHEAGYLDSARKNVENIASLYGKAEEAERIFADFEARIEALKAAAEGKTSLTGLVTSGSVSTLGNGSRCSLITNEVGFENVAVDVNATHGDTASFELLLEKNPDFIFVLDRDTAINSEGAKVAKEVMDNEIVRKTDAYQNDQIIYLTPDVWYLSEGGIQATDTMIKDLETGVKAKDFPR